jgi:acyl-CoA synthetase (AMP-forming)/AMP-acid ligase II
MRSSSEPAAARTIPELVQAAGARFCDRPAIEDGDTTITFADLAETGLGAARAFMAAGVARGDRAAIWAPNLHEWVVAAIGLQSAGAVLVPLNTRLKGAEAGYVLEKSGARVLCTVDAFVGNRYVALLRAARGGAAAGRPVAGLPALERIVLLRGGGEGIESWAEFLARGGAVTVEDARRRAEAVSPGDLSDILFTSGTTGKPKGVMTAHGQNLRAFRAWSEIVGLREGDRYLVVNPFFHSFGY